MTSCEEQAMSEEHEIKGLVKRYIDNGISRRKFLTTLTAIGVGYLFFA